MSELKKCPFCGGEDVHTRSYCSDSWHYVDCLTCGSSGPEADGEDEAIAAWNRRANSEQ